MSIKKGVKRITLKEQQKIIELYKQNLSLCKIGRMLNRNHDTISFQLRKAGVRTDSGYKRRKISYTREWAEKGIKVVRHKFKIRKVKSYEELLWEKRNNDFSYLSMLKTNYKDFYQRKVNE